MAVMLDASIARKQFDGDRTVLEDVALTMETGEIVAIVGDSGAGKTTLLRILSGIDTDFDGHVRWPDGAARLAMVFQEPRLLPWCTVAENLALVAPVEDTTALLASVGLTAERDLLAARLSVGMARRLAIARAFAVAPKLLLLDEPFVSLDVANAQRARELLLTLWRARPMGVILITHDLAEAAALADRILWLAGRPANFRREFVVDPDRRRADPAFTASAARRAFALEAGD